MVAVAFVGYANKVEFLLRVDRYIVTINMGETRREFGSVISLMGYFPSRCCGYKNLVCLMKRANVAVLELIPTDNSFRLMPRQVYL